MLRPSQLIKWLVAGSAILLFSPILLLMALTAVGYVWPVRVRDVPDAPRIGERCVVLKGLRAHGVFNEGGTKGHTDFVDITTLPGIGGYEITFTEPIPKGSEFVIKRAEKCWTCPFSSVQYLVSVPTLPDLDRYPTYIRDAALAPGEVKCRRP
jgi:hypothetical protein